ncbi:MAG TPA: hypothetical protein VKB39_04570, partial [Candidatus Baltobacteraceae bacterium]|nr:hypothetical protein [Candidatus Baltobacteraceae bacterium]
CTSRAFDPRGVASVILPGLGRESGLERARKPPGELAVGCDAVGVDDSRMKIPAGELARDRALSETGGGAQGYGASVLWAHGIE